VLSGQILCTSCKPSFFLSDLCQQLLLSVGLGTNAFLFYCWHGLHYYQQPVSFHIFHIRLPFCYFLFLFYKFSIFVNFTCLSKFFKIRKQARDLRKFWIPENQDPISLDLKLFLAALKNLQKLGYEFVRVCGLIT